MFGDHIKSLEKNQHGILEAARMAAKCVEHDTFLAEQVPKEELEKREQHKKTKIQKLIDQFDSRKKQEEGIGET